MEPVAECPYTEVGGRYEAFWRTLIADYAGARKATTQERNYFETWANRGNWNSRSVDLFNAQDKSLWQKSVKETTEQQAMGNMCVYMVRMGHESRRHGRIRM
jgi:transposase